MPLTTINSELSMLIEDGEVILAHGRERDRRRQSIRARNNYRGTSQPCETIYRQFLEGVIRAYVRGPTPAEQLVIDDYWGWSLDHLPRFRGPLPDEVTGGLVVARVQFYNLMERWNTMDHPVVAEVN